MYRFPYVRLRDTTILGALEGEYAEALDALIWNWKPDGIETRIVHERAWAESDAEDREDEMTGSIKLITSLATADGLVLLTPSLEVVGFGVKIKSNAIVGKVYDGADYVRRGAKARTIDVSKFGTRHGSMLRYCRTDREAIGVVVSQDGHVRLVASIGRSLVIWENVQLLGHEQDVQRYAKQRKQTYEAREQERHTTRRGYTSTPKTLDALKREARRPSSHAEKKPRVRG
ncbi:MAG: hypothetical protein QM820_23755 [Minicystis sp.]